MCACVLVFEIKRYIRGLRAAIDCALFSFITGETFSSVFALRPALSLSLPLVLIAFLSLARVYHAATLTSFIAESGAN